MKEKKPKGKCSNVLYPLFCGSHRGIWKDGGGNAAYNVGAKDEEKISNNKRKETGQGIKKREKMCENQTWAEFIIGVTRERKRNKETTKWRIRSPTKEEPNRMLVGEVGGQTLKRRGLTTCREA
ncbi:hypothetical protein JTE90_011799 [Oedothorax gibbosus]|uniref:Uncharacterized protein n=1 Tax=Oedothorax gibbosus TaxID=931172 RepID=A0AAV6VSW6_9ARAC|nr:hypothetical protein JTE90_011799 [Oedothorax gibbosus]